MAVDKNKIIAEATKLVQKGAIDKAIAAYQKITAEDPKDVRILLKIGELYQKKGDDKLAADAFQRVAETYAEQGFFLKAVAVYKQVVKHDPDDVRVNERLAALYQQLGLMSDAMSQLQLVATAYEKAGDATRLGDVLERMVSLDPDNIASSIKLGELHARSGQPERALECFRRAADYLKKHSRADEFVKVAERISALQPDDPGLTRELANIYLAKRDTKRALAKLQLCFKANPKDVDTLHLLAQAFRDLGQTTKTVSVYKELAHVHEEQGRASEAKATWRKVIELSPDDEEAVAALGGARAPTPAPVPQTPRAPSPGPPPGVRPAPSAAPAAAAPATGADAIRKLLTETDVYVKYGLHEKALEHVAKILALDPQSPEAYERAREVHVSARRPAEAGAAGAALVRALLARGDQDRAREAVARLATIAPSHPDLPELSAAAGGTEEVRLEPDDVGEVALDDAQEVAEVVLEPELEPAEPMDDDALALSAATADGDEIVDDDPSMIRPLPGAGVLVPEPPPARADDVDLAAAGDALAEAAAIASAESEEIVEEPPPPPPPARAAPPAARAAPRPAAKPAPIATPAPAVTPAPITKPAPVPTPAPVAARAAPPRAAAAPKPPPAPARPDLSDELEEADFLMQQGLLDDAREALTNLLAAHPGHPVAQAKLAELQRRDGSATPAAAAPGRASDAFDLASELAAEVGDVAPAEDEFQYSVEDVFNQFKKGVEQTVKLEDTATHYDLGIAYKEMGLLDDAVKEFEIALQGNDRKREVDCLSMVGICQLQKGAPAEAVKAYRRALGSQHLSKEAAKAIQFELGAAYEAAGDPQAALHYLQAVKALDAGFRDVASRIQKLGGGAGRPPADAERKPPARANGANGASAVNGAAAPRAAAAPARPAVAPPKKNIGYL